MANKKVYEKHEDFSRKDGREGRKIEKSERASDKKMGKSAPMKPTKKGK